MQLTKWFHVNYIHSIRESSNIKLLLLLYNLSILYQSCDDVYLIILINILLIHCTGRHFVSKFEFKLVLFGFWQAHEMRSEIHAYYLIYWSYWFVKTLQLVYVIGLHAVQFGNNWIKKISRTAKIGRGRTYLLII